MTGASDPAVSDLSITPNSSSGARLALASSQDVRDRDENPVVCHAVDFSLVESRPLNFLLKSSAIVRTQIKSAGLKCGCG